MAEDFQGAVLNNLISHEFSESDHRKEIILDLK